MKELKVGCGKPTGAMVGSPETGNREEEPMREKEVVSMAANVLLLNARYEPLRVIPVRRAVGLLMRGVAEGVDAEGALQLRLDDGRLETVLAGDVSLRPPA